MPLSKEEIVLRNTPIYTFYPKITSPMVGGGVRKITIFCLFTYRSYIPNMFKNGPVVLEKKMSMHDGRQLIAIGHYQSDFERTLEKHKKNMTL